MLVDFVTNEYNIMHGVENFIDFRDNSRSNKSLCRLVDRYAINNDYPTYAEYVEWVIGFAGPGFDDLSYLDIDPQMTVLFRPCFLVCTHSFDNRHYYLFDESPLSLSKAREVDKVYVARKLAAAVAPNLAYSNGYCWNIKTNILQRLDGALLDFLDGKSNIVNFLESSCYLDSIIVASKDGSYHEIKQVVSVIRICKNDYNFITHTGAEEDGIYAFTLDKGAFKLGKFNGCIIAK